MKFRKIFAVMAALVFIVLAGCSANESADETTTTTTPTQITTDNAVIKDADAVNLIKSYSMEELGLEGSYDDYHFMVGSDGVKVENNYYIKVIAGKITENESDNTYKIDEIGQYFIRYDASEILVYDKENDEYTKMKEVHKLPEKESGDSSESAQ